MGLRMYPRDIADAVLGRKGRIADGCPHLPATLPTPCAKSSCRTTIRRSTSSASASGTSARLLLFDLFHEIFMVHRGVPPEGFDMVDFIPLAPVSPSASRRPVARDCRFDSNL